MQLEERVAQGGHDDVGLGKKSFEEDLQSVGSVPAAIDLDLVLLETLLKRSDKPGPACCQIGGQVSLGSDVSLEDTSCLGGPDSIYLVQPSKVLNGSVQYARDPSEVDSYILDVYFERRKIGTDFNLCLNAARRSSVAREPECFGSVGPEGAPTSPKILLEWDTEISDTKLGPRCRGRQDAL